MADAETTEKVVWNTKMAKQYYISRCYWNGADFWSNLEIRTRKTYLNLTETK